MEKDIAPELYEKISAEISREIKNSAEIQKIYASIASGKADYTTAWELSEKIGEIYSNALKNNLTSGVLPDGKLYYNIAERTVRPALESCYGQVAEASTGIQQFLNESAGIGITAITPEINDDRIAGIVNKASLAENIEDAAWVLDEPIINFASSAVSDTIKANAEFHSKAGLSPTIKRTVVGKCCKWCEALAGTYSYPYDVPDDIYRRHERCRCLVEYNSGNGSRQNVHTKKWVDSNEQDKIEERKLIKELTDTNIQLFAKRSEDFETVQLPKKEYVHVMSEISTNLTEEQKSKRVFSKNIGDYVYTVENNGFGNYRVIDKEKIRGLD